jgi:repressor LexA
VKRGILNKILHIVQNDKIGIYTMPITLYKRQKQILDFIRQYIDKYGYSPTLSEIAESINVSSLATVHEHLQALVQKGVIRRFDGAVRGLELLDEKISSTLQGVELPVMGFIAAGQPIMTYTDPDATVTVSPAMVSGKKRSYVLQVKGDSMIEDGILDGDYVIIEEQTTARDGEIVVALIDNGLATLKRYYREPNRIRLEPANAAMEPIYATNVKIQGKCVGVIRRF